MYSDGEIEREIEREREREREITAVRPGLVIFRVNHIINYDITLPLFSTVLPSNSRLFLSCRPFVVIRTFSTGLVGVEVTFVCPRQETEVTSTPTRPVENVVITTKGLQDRNIHIFDGTTVENKRKTIN